MLKTLEDAISKYPTMTPLLDPVADDEQVVYLEGIRNYPVYTVAESCEVCNEPTKELEKPIKEIYLDCILFRTHNSLCELCCGHEDSYSFQKYAGQQVAAKKN